jgi:hypothetical protein
LLGVGAVTDGERGVVAADRKGDAAVAERSKSMPQLRPSGII